MSQNWAHEQALEKLCRLCGNNQATLSGRNPLSKEQSELQTNVLDSLDLDLTLDVAGVHPPYVCKACNTKLQRWRQNKNRNGKWSKRPSIDIVNFTPHTDNCQICNNTFLVPQEAIIKFMKDFARAKGLVVVEDSDYSIFLEISRGGQGIAKCLTLYPDCTWSLQIAGTTVNLPDFPSRLSDESIAKRLLEKVSSNSICPGNPDFEDIIQLFTNKGQNIKEDKDVASVDRGTVNFWGRDYSTTIRHSKCQLLVEEQKQCVPCAVYQSTLAMKRSRMKMQPETNILTAKNENLSKCQLIEKVQHYKEIIKSLKSKMDYLKEEVVRTHREESVHVPDDQHQEFMQMYNTHNEEILTKMPEGSRQRLLWEQQQKAFNVKDDRGMRWHPSILRWCIAIHSKSAAAYRIMKDSEYLKLPSESTIRDYSNFAPASIGFNGEYIARVVKDKLANREDYEKHVSIIMDEMKVKAGLVFSSSTGRVTGFVNMGTLTNELNDFQKRCDGKLDNVPEMATHVIAFMVRSLTSSFKFLLGFQPCQSVKAYELYTLAWEAAEIVETFGMNVWAFVSDGASSNRKFYKLHQMWQGPGRIIYKTLNPMAPEHCVYFICDTPHLLKTTRNNWERSGSTSSHTRHLLYNGKTITWQQLKELVEWDNGQSQERRAVGIRMLTKITPDHINLTPTLRMKVSLAAQVISTKVANAFQLQQDASSKMAGRSRLNLESTIKFVRMFDTFFDCLNVKNAFEGNIKPSKVPYEKTTDARFQWLTTEFLGWLAEWEEQTKSKPGLTSQERQKLCLSHETLEGLRITVSSFVEVTKLLLDIDGVKYILSEKFSQDPLEEYFAKQRGIVGRNENPTAAKFAESASKIHVAGEALKASLKGNTSNIDKDVDGDEWGTLKRRKRQSKSFPL